MTFKTIKALSAGIGLLGLASSAFGHGLVSNPPARNWVCGAVTKPDQVQRGEGTLVCGDAFFAPGMPPEAGYNFMSVLTHTTGRNGVGPRANVCGFNSETWNGAATVWDQPINWPTTPMTAGARNFTWDIQWGPHVSDTEDFRYWITVPGFQYQVGRPLSFSDFEATPFCTQIYSTTDPNTRNITYTNNPNITVAGSTMTTRCTVPSRTGRHVIYAEWGRNLFTFERFHGCIDVAFQGGGGGPTVTANITANQPPTSVTGAATVPLNGSASTCSTGCPLTYQWTLNSPNPQLYSIANPTAAQTTLTLLEPDAASSVSVTLTVSNGTAVHSASRQITHAPVGGSQWADLGALTDDPITMVVGDRVNVRTVNQSGQDAFWPTNPITITSANTGAAAWPLALGQAVNATGGAVRVGVLGSNDQVVPEASATGNHVFALRTANIVSAFLNRQIGNVPNAPTSLTAQAGNAQVTLAWQAPQGGAAATAYNVKRSLTSGGPYSNVQTGVTGTTYTNTGLTNGTTYFYVVTATNASGEGPLSNQASAMPSGGGGGGTGVVTVTTATGGSSPWYFENRLTLSNTAAITNLTVTIRVQRTAGITFNGSYETIGGFTRTNTPNASPITFTFARSASLAAGTGRLFVAQTNGNGTAHPSTGDTWTVTYTSGGQTFTLNGTF